MRRGLLRPFSGSDRILRFLHRTLAVRQEGGIIVTAFSVGRVKSDVELKTSGKGVPYLRMTFEEEIGRGSQARTQEIQVWAWNGLARQLNDAGVGKDSLIWVFGTLESTDFTWRDGVTRDKALKLRLSQWGFVGSNIRAEKAYSSPTAYGNAEVIDGDRETLPA